MNLYEKSIEVILANQHQSGAYIACPNFPNYRYCWLRDGSFIAYAMDLSGNHSSAGKFYRWVGRVIDRYSGKVTILASQLQNGQKPDPTGILNTRFTLEGYEEADQGWGNFQVDGYGSWLWGLAEHINITKDHTLLAELAEAITTTIEYLKLVWGLPNYDCWEEHPEYLHPYSLSTTVGGLAAINSLRLQGLLNIPELEIEQLIGTIKQTMVEKAVVDGRFIKHIQVGQPTQKLPPQILNGPDASLLGIAVPYGVFPIQDETMSATVEAIEKELWLAGGGVYRYQGDVYYGGGEWILLSAWLGWYYCRAGEPAKAQQLRGWIESTANENGELPEQVCENPLAPKEKPVWMDKWGPVASPLLWSHAMYIILVNEIEKATNHAGTTLPGIGGPGR